MRAIKITAALLSAVLAAAYPANVYAEQESTSQSSVYVDPVYTDFNKLEVGGAFGIRLMSGASAHIEVDFDSPEVTNEPYYRYDIADDTVYGFSVEGRTNTLDDYRYYHLTITAKNEDGTESEPYKATFEFPDLNDSTEGQVIYGFVINVTDEPGDPVEIVPEEPSEVAEANVIGYYLTFHIASYTLGDVNNDGLIDPADASAVLVENAEAADGGGSFTDTQKSAADVNGDGLVDSADASLILAYNAYCADSGTLSIAEWVKQS